ncbi:hypothetical protein CSIM01_01774 [Colletotrichum simmondsii]|uniref:Uncharacterized protein n=1 Tax=Colletotrichum simmondsii TaxID=703756 RepID=A0A135T4E6_9PEZI|nr:hypothetical protein CSIM01_01774 [Colletotrichum simmondsii]
MRPVQDNTWVLAPDWIYLPGKPMAIGNIMFDPLDPGQCESQVDPESPAAHWYDTVTVNDKNWKKTDEVSSSLEFSIWLKFLELVTAKISASDHHVTQDEYTMDFLQTTYHSGRIHPSELERRCSEPNIEAYMKLDSRLCSRPVYMVTGIKIAKKFVVKQSKSSSDSVRIEVTAEVTPGASVGGGAGGSTNQSVSQGFESMEDIVYAYQLIKIQRRGWWHRRSINAKKVHTAAFIASVEQDDRVKASFPAAKELRRLGDTVQIVSLHGGKADQATVVYKAPHKAGGLSWVPYLLSLLRPCY